jgi:hypothetical protein
VSINGRGKDCSLNGLGDEFQGLWYDNLVQAQAIQASFLMESNAGFDASVSFSFLLFDKESIKRLSRPLSQLLEHGLFEPEQGESQKWGQRNSKYATTVGTQLLAKIHVLDDEVGQVYHRRGHPIDRLDERIDFVREVSDCIGKVVDELNNCIDV